MRRDLLKTLFSRMLTAYLTITLGLVLAIGVALVAMLREQGVQPYILSTQACAICTRCAILDNQPCRHPDKMHPCVESHGINVVPTLEQLGLDFQFGSNVVTWISLLFF